MEAQWQRDLLARKNSPAFIRGAFLITSAGAEYWRTLKQT